MKVYILYKNADMRALLDMSYNLDDIIESLGYCIDDIHIDYTISEKTELGERELYRIRSVDDYSNLRFVTGKKLILK